MKDTKQLFIERHQGGERAILVQVDLFQQTHPYALEEFKELADSANLETLAIVQGKRTTPEPKFFVGTGKAEEIQQLVKTHKAEVVLFNHELSPAQGRNLETLFECRVLDRTELILDIFAQRARTFEGKLQVELAQLQHLRTRLVRGWTHLERQKGGIGLRGPGETQLETDRRLIDVRIRNLKKRLEKVAKQRHQGRRARRRAALPTISLVGYTNAGKSTLFNQLTESSVYAASKLFATLDPTLRQVQLPKLGKVILADTVGFIRDLPHELVAAFSATLEETREADLLLHVVDAHQPDASDVIGDVDEVLEAIGADEVLQLQVYNKIDLLEGYQPRIDCGRDGRPKRVWLSAQTGEGFDLLFQAIVELLSGQLVRCEVRLMPEEAKKRAALYELDVVKSERIDEEGHQILQLEIQRSDYDKLFGKDGA
ncbi:MAG: GTPase HflX [Coxiellaceae bacterium]|nr:GTPase HflX [Coxiellaceae bacterium]